MPEADDAELDVVIDAAIDSVLARMAGMKPEIWIKQIVIGKKNYEKEKQGKIMNPFEFSIPQNIIVGSRNAR